MSDKTSQVFCGPFLPQDLPDFQAAISHCDDNWARPLNESELEFVKAIIYRTARFGIDNRSRRMPMKWFFDGHLGNMDKGYAGCPSMLTVSARKFRDIRDRLQYVYQIVNYRNGRYSIDYSITALDLVQHEAVQKSLIHRNRHNPAGQLSSIEGMQSWAKEKLDRLIQASIVNPQRARLLSAHGLNLSGSQILSSGKPEISSTSRTEKQSPPPIGRTKSEICSNVTPNSKRSNTQFPCKKTGPYSVPLYKTHVIPSPKGSGIMGEDITDMSKIRSSADILRSIEKEVRSRSAKVDSKRKARGTLADRCALFEKAWMRGQRERSNFAPPSRIVGTDRALLKTQIIKPATNTEVNLADMAEWCTENWDAIGGQYFEKARSYPENPAFRWFMKCFATYVVAFQQKDYLDDAATRNTTDLLKRAATADMAEETFFKTTGRAKDTIKSLKAQLAEANARLREAETTGTLEPDDFERELHDVISVARKPRRKLRKHKK